MTTPQPGFTLYYFHDPMCSWCWGFRPTWQALQENLPDTVAVQYVLGGLAPDSDQSMPDELRRMIQNTWQRIQQELGTEFNFDFWTQNTPRRSTFPACRAVIAAHQQGMEQEMILAIQQAYYLRALNPSDLSILRQLGEEIGFNESGFDTSKFNDALTSETTDQTLHTQRVHSRQWVVQGYPSLVLKRNDADSPAINEQDLTQEINNVSLAHLAHIPVDYHQYSTMLSHLHNAISKL